MMVNERGEVTTAGNDDFPIKSRLPFGPIPHPLQPDQLL